MGGFGLPPNHEAKSQEAIMDRIKYTENYKQVAMGMIFSIICKTYNKESEMAKIVYKGLQKLNKQEINGLLIMIETSIK
jgi:hypothetical protein